MYFVSTNAVKTFVGVSVVSPLSKNKNVVNVIFA